MRAALLAAGLLWAAAAPAQTLRVTGRVEHPAALDLDALRAMPATTVERSAGEGARTATYAGPLLWDILAGAAPIDAPGEGAAGRSHLQHVVIARGQDGYAVAIAIGEIDPAFEGKKIVVGLPRDGQADLRLAVPGDVKAGRGVHDLVELEVR